MLKVLIAACVGALIVTDAVAQESLLERGGYLVNAVRLQMQRQFYFSKMTDQDLDALVAWVRTIPPAE